MQISIAAIICAAGTSQRFADRMGNKKKEYLPLSGGSSLTVLGAAVSAFFTCPEITPIVIAVSSPEEAKASLPPELLEQDRILFASGGPSRRASVYNSLLLLEPHNPSHVLIHDGARPWIKPCLIEKIIEAAIKYGAVIPALPLVETPKELKQSGSSEIKFIERHLRRTQIYTAQTPQGFQFPQILSAHKKALEKENYEYTDDAEVWGEFIGEVAVIEGDGENRKITFPGDI